MGIQEARAQLGRLVEELGPDTPVLLTKRGRVVAVLVDPGDYEELITGRSPAALARLRELVPKLRESVSAAGLDEGIVDEAIATRRQERRAALKQMVRETEDLDLYDESDKHRR